MAFGLGFPLVVLFLLSAIQANIPVSLFEISQLTPGIAVFGLSFISLFPEHSSPRTELHLTYQAFCSPSHQPTLTSVIPCPPAHGTASDGDMLYCGLFPGVGLQPESVACSCCYDSGSNPLYRFGLLAGSLLLTSRLAAFAVRF
jgi:hypothetical protein